MTLIPRVRTVGNGIREESSRWLHTPRLTRLAVYPGSCFGRCLPPQRSRCQRRHKASVGIGSVYSRLGTGRGKLPLTSDVLSEALQLAPIADLRSVLSSMATATLVPDPTVAFEVPNACLYATPIIGR